MPAFLPSRPANSPDRRVFQTAVELTRGEPLQPRPSSCSKTRHGNVADFDCHNGQLIDGWRNTGSAPHLRSRLEIRTLGRHGSVSPDSFRHVHLDL